MKECVVFIENKKNIAVYTNFQKFRRLSFHYILDFLIHHNKFENKLEAGKKLKSEFTKFYSKNRIPIKFEDNTWEVETFFANELENIYQKTKKEDYESTYTKLSPIKCPKSFNCLNKDLDYLPLEPLYGR